MDNDDARRRWRGGEAALGGLLVLLGLVVLLGQAVDLEVSRVAWPLFVLVPGLGLLGVGLAARGRSGSCWPRSAGWWPRCVPPRRWLGLGPGMHEGAGVF
jgi:protein-S-isoprenylcysteine O-methyltransferase Ste14